MIQLQFEKDDGGRREYGFKGEKAGDCVARAIAIATGKDYGVVYNALAEGNVEFGRNGRGRVAKKAAKIGRSARNGVFKQVYEKYLEECGWSGVQLCWFGSPVRFHLLADELPEGRLVASVSKHMTAVIDHVIRDAYNPSRGGTRMVYKIFIPNEDLDRVIKWRDRKVQEWNDV